MLIHGLQKMTLLDFPGRVACTVFLGGCDLRCPYCHNAELINGSAPAVMDDGELLAFLKKRVGLLDGVAVTGGEPLLRDIAPLLREVRALGYAVKLDTNGTHPARLRALLDEGLVDYVAMDVKNSPERYAETVGVAGLDLAPIRESAALLMEGRVDYEFRTTVCRELHDDDAIRGVGEFLAGARRLYLQPFADRDTVAFAGFSAPDMPTLERWAEILRGFVGEVGIRGAD